MNKSEKNSPVMKDVLQSDHHVQMSAEEIAKAKAHHEKRHGGMNPKDSGKNGGNPKANMMRPR